MINTGNVFNHTGIAQVQFISTQYPQDISISESIAEQQGAGAGNNHHGRYTVPDFSRICIGPVNSRKGGCRKYNPRKIAAKQVNKRFVTVLLFPEFIPVP